MIYRQGDVLLKEIKEMPRKPNKVNHGILAMGEATGHSHSLMDGLFRLYEHSGCKYIEVIETTRLVHQEHNSLQIEPGYYEVIIEREYDPFEEAIRKVVD